MGNGKCDHIEPHPDVSNSNSSKSTGREVCKSVHVPSKVVHKDTSHSNAHGESGEYPENVPVQSPSVKSPFRRSNRLSNDPDAPFSGEMASAYPALKPLDQASSLKRSKSSMGSFHIIEGPHKGEVFSIHDFIKSTKDIAVLGRSDRFGVMSLNRDSYVSES